MYIAVPQFGEIPEPQALAKKSLAQFLQNYGYKSIKHAIESGRSFPDVIEEISNISRQLYFEAEKAALRKTLMDNGFPEKDLNKLLDILLHPDKGLIKSVQNTRMARGGLSAQYTLWEMLNNFGIPAEIPSQVKGRKKGYRLDIAIPSLQKLQDNPKNALALAVKRTLRERWHSDLPIFEHYPNAAFILMTPDPKFNEKQAVDMVEAKMQLVFIPDKLYKARSAFIKNYKIFRPLSELPSYAKKFC